MLPAEIVGLTASPPNLLIQLLDSMKTQFNLLRATRKNILKAIEGLSLEALNTIPTGFNNNIIWNATHVVVTQQLLTYGLTANKLRIPKEIVTDYKKGSKPAEPVLAQDVSQTVDWLSDSVDWLAEDLDLEIFKEFKTYPTSYGYTLNSIEDAVTFNNVHEAMHLGWINAIKKSL